MDTYGLIHLSDIHIGEGRAEADNTKKIIQFISAGFPQRPVLVTGDITDSGTERQFRTARRLFDTLARTNPILVVPGNHDYAYIGNFCHEDAWKNWVKYLGSPLGWGGETVAWMEREHEPEGIDGLGVWKHGELVFFGIDSGDPRDEVISARGYISQELADGLEIVLKKYQDKIRIAMLHHHPFTSAFLTALKGADRLMKVLKGNCEVLLFGHDHNYGIWKKDLKIEIPLVVASHKSTERLSGKCGMIALIDIEKNMAGSDRISHRLEVLSL